MKKISIVLMIAIVAISCTSTNEAERGINRNDSSQGRPNSDEIFAKLDTNKDSKISKDEAEGPLKNDFSKIDTNNDGYITKVELEKAPKPERQGGGQGDRRQGGQR